MLTTLESNEHFTVERIARTVLNRLNANNLVAADAGQPVFFGFAHTDRLVLAFDPTTLRDPYALRSITLRQKISADLQGRRVVFTGKNGIFLQIVMTHLKYMPEKALDVMQQVFAGFKMPSLRLIPNARNFVHAVAKTGLHTAERHLKFIHNPVLKSLGLEDSEAFNRAVQAAKLLPIGLGPDQVKLGRTGEFVIAY